MFHRHHISKTFDKFLPFCNIYIDSEVSHLHNCSSWNKKTIPTPNNFYKQPLHARCIPLHRRDRKYFKNKLYEYPRDNFVLKIIGQYKWIKMSGFDWFIATYNYFELFVIKFDTEEGGWINSWKVPQLNMHVKSTNLDKCTHEII